MCTTSVWFFWLTLWLGGWFIVGLWVLKLGLFVLYSIPLITTLIIKCKLVSNSVFCFCNIYNCHQIFFGKKNRYFELFFNHNDNISGDSALSQVNLSASRIVFIQKLQFQAEGVKLLLELHQEPIRACKKSGGQLTEHAGALFLFSCPKKNWTWFFSIYIFFFSDWLCPKLLQHVWEWLGGSSEGTPKD